MSTSTIRWRLCHGRMGENQVLRFPVSPFLPIWAQGRDSFTPIPTYRGSGWVGKMAPQVQEIITALGDPLPSPIVTERRLRSLINLPAKEQKEKIERILFD